MIWTEVRVPGIAQPTMEAGYLRIDRHSLPDFKWLMSAVKRIVAHRNHRAHELVTRHERAGRADMTDLTGLVEM